MTTSDNGTVNKDSPQKGLALGVTLVVLVMAVGFSLFVWNLMTTIEQLNRSLSSAQAEVDRLRIVVAELKEVADMKGRILQIVASKQSVVIPLKGGRANADVYGTVVLNPHGNIALVWNLDTLTGEERYVLWGVAGRDTTKLGVLINGEDPLLVAESLAVGEGRLAGGIVITREPRDDYPRPSGVPIVYSQYSQ